LWNIHTYDELPSTQSHARTELEHGVAKHGDVIQALHQTSGRGRYENRRWHDRPGENLLMSITLTDVTPGIVEKMQFLAGLALLRALRLITAQSDSKFKPERIRLKWINDILVDEKKISGILSDALWSGSTLRGVVIGIGVNINQSDFHEDIEHRATSLKALTGIDHKLEEVRSVILAAFGNALDEYRSLQSLMFDVAHELEWMRQLHGFDLLSPDGTAENGLTYLGITEDGLLWVRNDMGTIRAYDNATLRIL
jgi:BirA family transcriptional regulator, biotin operon repressor / biotin---[acetyl-CoA-carboxylase] ligase